MKLRLAIFAIIFLCDGLFAQSSLTWNFDHQLQSFFGAETQRLTDATSTELASIDDWDAYRKTARTELLDMLGLYPMPERTPLQAVITGTTEHEAFRVEKVHFQASPGLYVTGNLYIPKNATGRMPAILYVCGHANVKKDGVSYGAKVNYHHHAAWFARHGYVCLIIDTLQLGEIEGIHHGLYRYDRWWWLSRGYTPAGVEAWFAIRSIDYLVSRPEVDAERIGMTGRSGGGINSWWGVALDDRIKVAVPVAGVTDLQNHVIDDCVEGHCDCMYMVNTYQWDYAKLVALAAPRPLLISNSDQDPIFPIDGVFRIYMKVRELYQQLDAKPRIALNTASGPHKDVQELRVHAFRWFNHYLQGHDELIDEPAVKFFEPEQLRVFEQLPADETNTRIDEVFVPKAPPAAEVLAKMGWEAAAEQWRSVIDRYAFAEDGTAHLEKWEVYSSPHGRMELWELASDEHTRLPLFRLSPLRPAGRGTTQLIVLDDEAWRKWSVILKTAFPTTPFGTDVATDSASLGTLAGLFEESDELILLPMRGAGPAAFSGDKETQTHIRRRFFLLGRTLEEMQTLDLVQALKALELTRKPARVEASGPAAGMLVYASLYSPIQLSLKLHQLPPSHHDGPQYLSIMRDMDLPAGLLLAAKQHEVSVYTDGTDAATEQWVKLKELAKRYEIKGLKVQAK